MSDAGLMRSIIGRIATGPHLSKDISAEEARAGMRLILEGEVSPVQAAIFLVALRMKRETEQENRGILEAIRDVTRSAVAPVDHVLHIVDPYNGFTRNLLVSPFMLPVLASCGVACASHGVESVGPKFGATHRLVLAAAGVAVDCTPAEAAVRLGRPEVGWCYVDQRQFCPKLHDLNSLRTEIVKRPVLTTVEVLADPVRGRIGTHLVTGYVHKPYPPVYLMLARHTGYASAMVVRGVEGGVIPSLRQAGKAWSYHDQGRDSPHDLEPSALGLGRDTRAVPLPEGGEMDTPAMAAAAARAGGEALDGRPGTARDALVYGTALCLWHLGREPTLEAAAAAARSAIDSGRARAHLDAARAR